MGVDLAIGPGIGCVASGPGSSFALGEHPTERGGFFSSGLATAARQLRFGTHLQSLGVGVVVVQHEMWSD